MSATRLVSSRDIIAALARRFAAPEFVLLEQVRNGAGAHAERTADAIAMSVWPSRGLEIHGFEIKVRRNDWRREMKAPAKAEAIAGYCHYWWLAVEQGVVKNEEIPDQWGLFVLNGDPLVEMPARGLGVNPIKHAPRREPRQLDHGFLAAVLRSLVKDQTDIGRIAAAREAGRKQGRLEASTMTAAMADAKLRALERDASWILREAQRSRYALLNPKEETDAEPDSA